MPSPPSSPRAPRIGICGCIFGRPCFAISSPASWRRSRRPTEVPCATSCSTRWPQTRMCRCNSRRMCATSERTAPVLIFWTVLADTSGPLTSSSMRWACTARSVRRARRHRREEADRDNHHTRHDQRSGKVLRASPARAAIPVRNRLQCGPRGAVTTSSCSAMALVPRTTARA